MSGNAREVIQNDSSSQLNGAVNSSVTALVVDDGNQFPSSGRFRIVVDQEIMLCTARVTHTLTVVRGHEGSSAASHLDNANVKMILTAEGIRDYIRSSVPLFDLSGQPSLTYGLRDKTGAFLTKASFTNLNHDGGTVVTDTDNHIVIQDDGAASNYNWRIIHRTYTNPLTLIVAASTFMGAAGDDCYVGPMFVETGTGKLVALSLYEDNGVQRLAVWRWTSPTAWSSTTINWGIKTHPIEWFKMVDDGTNLIFYASHNGVQWAQVHSQARTTHFTGTPDAVGYGISCDSSGGSAGVISNLLVWDES